MPEPIYNVTTPNWTPLERAVVLAELPPDVPADFMWMCENPEGTHQYKNQDTRNYAHLTGQETRDQALVALNHAYSSVEKWRDRPNLAKVVPHA